MDITCKVSGHDGTDQWKFSVAAVMPDTGNARQVSQFWVVKNGVNSTDKKVQANGTYKFLWDAKAELGQVAYDNMVMRVNVVRFNDNHDAVQLWGGGPYWATTNIGAENPEDYGYYFWWGDTVGYKRENDRWKASDGSSSNFLFDPDNAGTWDKNIITLQREGWIKTTSVVLEPAHDAAQVHWGGNWRMPTKQELSNLYSKCDWTWTTVSGVEGYVVKGKGVYASASIFLPAAGYGLGPWLQGAGSYGEYWSSFADSGYGSAWALCFNWEYPADDVSSQPRETGRPVRPVRGFAE